MRPRTRHTLAVVAALMLAAITAGAPVRAETPRVAVVAIVDHPDIDAMRRGIGDSLRAAAQSSGADFRLDYATAGADPARVDAIADAIAGGGADLAIALSEPMARALAGRPLRIPVIVCGLPLDQADAIAASRQAKLLTGVAFGTNIDAQFELIATMRPATRTVLVPWIAEASGEPPVLRTLAAMARTRAFSVVLWRLPAGDDPVATLPPGTDPATSIVYLSAQLAGRRADALIAVAGRNAMPIVADSRALVVRGATAAIIHDFYAIGRQAGNLAAAILRDPTRALRPVRRAEAHYLVVNGEAAADPRLDLAVPLESLANEVIAWAEPAGPNPQAKPRPPVAAETGEP